MAQLLRILMLAGISVMLAAPGRAAPSPVIHWEPDSWTLTLSGVALVGIGALGRRRT